MRAEERAKIDLSESAGNSFTLGPYVETSGLTDDELITLGSFLAHNPVQMLLQARAALEPFALEAENPESVADTDYASVLFTVAQLRAARAAWRALGGDPQQTAEDLRVAEAAWRALGGDP